MLKEFIRKVDIAEANDKKSPGVGPKTVKFEMPELIAARDLIKTTLDARSKGGKNRYKHAKLKNDPDSIKNRERVRLHRQKKAKEGKE